jgi:hypothetical protein
MQYWGGYGQCGKGNTIWREFARPAQHPGTNSIIFKGKIWTMDSWDNENFTVQLLNANGQVMAERTQRGNNFERLGDETMRCSGSPTGGWDDGYFNVELTAPWSVADGAVTVKITNTLNQGTQDESIAYSDLFIKYTYDPTVTVPVPSTEPSTPVIP